jgi:uncharacterized protein
MKSSAYNFVWPTDDPERAIIFNSATTALVEVTKNNLDLLQSARFDYRTLPSGARKFVDALTDGGFLVDDDVDELMNLKLVVNTRKYDRSSLELTIAPTLRCNFACPYCYEQSPENGEKRNGRSGMMSASVCAGLLKLIEGRAKQVKKISVTWFGGEPMLARSLIFDLSRQIIRIADAHQIEYHAGMITNGYLFDKDPEIIRKLKESRISFFQVTIDGPPEVHNLRRKLKKSTNPTFDRVLETARLLARNEMTVAIRINVDRSNKDEALKLLDILDVNDLKSFRVGLGCVMARTAGCQSMQHSCISMEEFSASSQELRRRLDDRNFNAGPSPDYPRCLQICSANRLTPLAIDPDGDMYKCWDDIGVKSASIGNVTALEKRSGEEMTREARWVTWQAFDYPECRACNVLPICLGSCAYGPVTKGEKPQCMEWKYGLEQYVRAQYAGTKSATVTPSRDVPHAG